MAVATVCFAFSLLVGGLTFQLPAPSAPTSVGLFRVIRLDNFTCGPLLRLPTGHVTFNATSLSVSLIEGGGTSANGGHEAAAWESVVTCSAHYWINTSRSVNGTIPPPPASSDTGELSFDLALPHQEKVTFSLSTNESATENGTPSCQVLEANATACTLKPVVWNVNATNDLLLDLLLDGIVLLMDGLGGPLICDLLEFGIRDALLNDTTVPPLLPLPSEATGSPAAANFTQNPFFLALSIMIAGLPESLGLSANIWPSTDFRNAAHLSATIDHSVTLKDDVLYFGSDAVDLNTADANVSSLLPNVDYLYVPPGLSLDGSFYVLNYSCPTYDALDIPSGGALPGCVAEGGFRAINVRLHHGGRQLDRFVNNVVASAVADVMDLLLNRAVVIPAGQRIVRWTTELPVTFTLCVLGTVMVFVVFVMLSIRHHAADYVRSQSQSLLDGAESTNNLLAASSPTDCSKGGTAAADHYKRGGGAEDDIEGRPPLSMLDLLRGVLEDTCVILVGCAVMMLYLLSNTTTGVSVVLGGHVNWYDYSLVSSVRNLWNAGLYPLSVLIMIFCGPYAYFKVLSLMVSHVILRRNQSALLRWIDVIGRFSFIDSFVMVITVAALCIPKIAEVSILPSFYIFVIATALSILLANVVVRITPIHERRLIAYQKSRRQRQPAPLTSAATPANVTGELPSQQSMVGRPNTAQLPCSGPLPPPMVNPHYSITSSQGGGDYCGGGGGSLASAAAPNASVTHTRYEGPPPASNPDYCVNHHINNNSGKEAPPSSAASASTMAAVYSSMLVNGSGGGAGGSSAPVNRVVSPYEGMTLTGGPLMVSNGSCGPNGFLAPGPPCYGAVAVPVATATWTPKMVVVTTVAPIATPLPSHQPARFGGPAPGSTGGRDSSCSLCGQWVAYAIPSLLTIGFLIPALAFGTLRYNFHGLGKLISGQYADYSFPQQWAHFPVGLQVVFYWTVVIAPSLYALAPRWRWALSWCATDVCVLACLAALIQLRQFVDFTLGSPLNSMYSVSASLWWPFSCLCVSVVVQYVACVRYAVQNCWRRRTDGPLALPAEP